MYVQEDQNYNQPQVSLPNATAVLILGIVSIIMCCCYGSGLVLGIIALILANRDMKRYFANPGMFTAASYSNLRAGRVCAIIAVSIAAIYIIFMVVIIATFGWATLHDPNAFRAAMENMVN